MASRPAIPAPNHTLTNGLRVLDLVARTHRDFSVTELAGELSLPKSHVHRLLRTWSMLGYLAQSPDTRKYRSDYRVLALARPSRENLPLRVRGGPVLRKLSGESRGAAYLAVLHRDAPLIVMSDVYRGKKASHHLGLGSRLNRHATAFGKLFSALKRLPLGTAELEPLTPFTITGLRELRAEFETIRRQDYSVSRRENRAGLTAFASPVRSSTGELLGAVGLAVAATQVDHRGEELFIRLVVEAAATLSG